MMIRVGEKVLDGFGARLSKAELFEDGVDGHGPSEQSLSGSLVEQRLGDVEELLRSEQDVVGLIGLAFEHVRRGRRNKRVEHGGAVDDRVTLPGLDAQRPVLDVAQQDRHTDGGVEEESVAYPRDLERAGIGHSAREHAASSVGETRIGESEAVDEDDGVSGEGVADILELEDVVAFDEHAGPKLQVELLGLGAAPVDLTEESAVDERADMMVGVARKVASTL